MSETWARLAWVLGAVVVATAAILILRYRIRERPMVIQQALLGSGVYLFTSATCPDCEAARRLLVEAIGPSSFVELSWESHPETFRDIGIGAVPATLIVREAGRSTIYRGRPDQAVEALSP